MCNFSFDLSALFFMQGYRQYVLSTIPTLVNLDFSTVTKGDVITAKTWQASNMAQKPKKIYRD